MSSSSTSGSETYVYRLYNQHGRLLYVGVTDNPHRRMRDHAWWQWYKSVAALSLTLYPNRSAALAAEAVAIKTEWPLWNLGGSPWHATVLEFYHHQIAMRPKPNRPLTHEELLERDVREAAVRKVQADRVSVLVRQELQRLSHLKAA